MLDLIIQAPATPSLLTTRLNHLQTLLSNEEQPGVRELVTRLRESMQRRGEVSRHRSHAQCWDALWTNILVSQGDSMFRVAVRDMVDSLTAIHAAQFPSQVRHSLSPIRASSVLTERLTIRFSLTRVFLRWPRRHASVVRECLV